MYGADVYKHEYVDFEDFLGGSEEKCFDFVVSVASFHHKSFPNYLTQIRRALADDGALVSGDWHSAFWHHPYNLYRLLEAVGTEEKRLNALARLFGGLLTPSPGWEPSPEELQAVSDHFDYWRNVHSEVRGLGSAGRARLYMLKANQTSREHADNLQAAEFTTNADDIRKAFQGASLADLPRSLLRGSDFAVVTAAIKKR
jgi:SAM-dependent methyltransferase